MDTSLIAQRRFAGAALAATLWHPYLALALHNIFGWLLPGNGGALVLIPLAIAVAWLVCFLAEYLLVPPETPRWVHVDNVMQDTSLGLAEKLRGVASSWIGRALIAGFVVYVGVVSLAIVRAVMG